MDEPLKRDLRREKREIKKAGVRRVRRGLKQKLHEVSDLDETPVIDYGPLSSAPLNGIDRDSTRRRDEPK
jgi:hypothetical protein